MWFKVDDNLALHPKVIAAGNAAMGLWVRAGAYCAQQLTDGFVPDHIVTALGGTRNQVRKLVEVGLWSKAKGGYLFHDWASYQPTKADVIAERERNKERQARWRARRGTNAVTDTVTDSGTNGVTNPVSNAAPTRPVHISPLTPRSYAAALLGWEEDDDRLNHLDAYLETNNVRSPRQWLNRCHKNGELADNLTRFARQREDPYAHLPWLNGPNANPEAVTGDDPA